MTAKLRLYLLLAALLGLIGGLAAVASAAATNGNAPLGVNSSVAQQTSGPPGSGWSLVFSDEFNGTSLDTSKWHTCYWWATDWNQTGCSNEGNGELEWYQPGQVTVSNGLLNLKAEKRSVKAGFPYISGMVSSHDKFDYTYGYAEARVKVPKGKGLWPAFWMEPIRHWPPEIDMMEILGHDPSTVYMTLHWGSNSATHKSQTGSWRGPDFSAGFHTFAVDWRPGLAVWYVDGVERFRMTSNVAAEPMHLILNLAVGGHWPGSPDSTTVFPAVYQVDYVRVWKQTGTQPTPVPPTPTKQATTVPPTPTKTPAQPTATVVNTGLVVPTMRVDVVPTSAGVGQNVTANLQLFNAGNLYGLQIACAVNPAVITGKTRSDGDVFSAANSTFTDSGFGGDGRWLINVKRNAPYTGSGRAFTLNYTVRAAGQTGILCNAYAVDAAGKAVWMNVQHGAFTGTTAPQPTVVAPTSVAPTTVAPTSVAPTTIAPTSVAPTAVVPTTIPATPIPPTPVPPTAVPPTVVAPMTAPTGRVEVVPAAAGVGQPVAVNIQLANAGNMYGVQVACAVNNVVLTGVSRADGDIFNGGNSTFTDSGFMGDGRWEITARSSAPYSGSGRAFTLNYTVRGKGTTAVNCNIHALNASGQAVWVSSQNGSFTGQ